MFLQGIMFLRIFRLKRENALKKNSSNLLISCMYIRVGCRDFDSFWEKEETDMATDAKF